MGGPPHLPYPPEPIKNFISLVAGRECGNDRGPWAAELVSLIIFWRGKFRANGCAPSTTSLDRLFLSLRVDGDRSRGSRFMHMSVVPGHDAHQGIPRLPE